MKSGETCRTDEPAVFAAAYLEDAIEPRPGDCPVSTCSFQDTSDDAGDLGIVV